MTNGGHPDDGGSGKPVAERPGTEKKSGEKPSPKASAPTSGPRGSQKPRS
jgi:hypothetical protein